jgi:NADH-quinone oxidoreductase subunit K
MISFEAAVQVLIIFLIIMFFGFSSVLINWHNLLFTIFAIEIVNISAIMILIVMAKIMYDPHGYIIANILLWLTASESALSLGILVVLFKFGGSIKYNSYSNLQG